MFKIQLKLKSKSCQALDAGGCVREAGLNPTRDWRIILAIFFPLAIIIGGFSFYSYWSMNNEDFLAILPDTPVRFETVDKKSLDQIIEFYELRKSKTDALLVGPSRTLIDPSL